jgi:soluble lytic murein transglycosylase-like protein
MLGWYFLIGMLGLEIAAYGLAGWAASYCRSLAGRQFNMAVAVGQEVDKVPYAAMINSVAKREKVSARLVASVIETESSFQPRAVSVTGAAGLMQILPATWQEVNTRIRAGGNSQADYFDPERNIRVGTAYLHQQLEHYRGDTVLALAAYTAGAGTVDRSGGVPADDVTQEYLDRVMQNWYRLAAAPVPDSLNLAWWWAGLRLELVRAILATACLTAWVMQRLRRGKRSWRWR